MATEDKMNNKVDELKGRTKQAVGEATDDEHLEQEGRVDAAKADLKQAGEKIKDMFRR